MQDKELNELSDQSLLSLYKALIPSTSVLEYLGERLDNHGGGKLRQIKEKAASSNEIGYETDKSLLNYKRHLIELKIFSLKVLEEINRRELETSDSYDLINKEIDYNAHQIAAAYIHKSPIVNCKLINKFKSPFIMIVKTPIKHAINPIIFVKFTFSWKKK